ncbi:MAG: hypothetical protein KAI66_00720 [Lentisphaeria bacterium]|nr:hypothetical protein [Lentisphaeria bacterium]
MPPHLSLRSFLSALLFVGGALTRSDAPALASISSDAWRAADDAKRTAAWHADNGSRMKRGRLRVEDGATGVARRLLLLDMDRTPFLTVEIDHSGNVVHDFYVRRLDTGEAVLLEAKTTDGGKREFSLGARTDWTGIVKAELVAAVTGAGKLSLGTPELALADRASDLRSPQSVWRHVERSGKSNRFYGCRLTALGTPGPLQSVRFGIPFPKGAIHRPERLWLRTERDVVAPLQTQPLAVWPDGSVRWLLIDTVCAIAGSGKAGLLLSDEGERVEAPPIARPDGDAIVLSNRHFSLRVPQNGFGPIQDLPGGLTGDWDFVVVADGTTYAASNGTCQATIEYNGPVRGVVVLRGTLSDGSQADWRYELRITVCTELDQVHLEPTFSFVGETAEAQLAEATLHFEARNAPGVVAVGLDRVRKLIRPAGQELLLMQPTFKKCGLLLGGRRIEVGVAAKGWLHTKELTVAVRRFREQFSKALAINDSSVRIELWAPGAGARRFGQGSSKTHQILFDFSADSIVRAEHVAKLLDTPAALFPGERWYATSEALGRYAIPSSQNAYFDTVYERSLQRRIDERERKEKTSYGMIAYGDIGHINSEIDAQVAFFLQWARTGERKWLDFALDWALHAQDVDVCQYSANPRQIGIHHSHYPSDHNNGGLTLTHTWIRGILFRYYLTGDRRSLENAALAANAVRRSVQADGQLFDGGTPGAGIGSRAYGRVSWALCELYRATNDPALLKLLERTNGFLARGLHADGAVGASHDGGGQWKTTDECPHMAAICAVGLARYVETTGGDQFLPALERIAKWQIARGAMPQKLGIMYHNYSGGEVIHFIDACADMLEAWAFLYDETGNELYRDSAESIYDNMLEMSARWQNDWTMGIRNILFYLARREEWVVPDEPGEPNDRATAGWLRSCQNRDGGFGAVPGLLSDMDSTTRALEALSLLGEAPANQRKAAQWILSCRNTDGGYAGEPGWHSNSAWTWLALRALGTLGARPPESEQTVAWLQSCWQDSGGCGAAPVQGPLAYHPSWSTSSEYTACNLGALAMLRQKPANSAGAREFLLKQRAESGGFSWHGGEGSTAYTLLAVQALTRLGEPADGLSATASWLSSLRNVDGGYSLPRTSASNLRNTAHAVLALNTLGAIPQNAETALTRRYIRKCAADGGGYAHRPGRTATVQATWYALSARKAL